MEKLCYNLFRIEKESTKMNARTRSLARHARVLVRAFRRTLNRIHAIRRMRTKMLFAATRKMVAVPPPIHLRHRTAIAVFPGGGNESISNLRFEINWPAFTELVFVAGTRGDPPTPIKKVRRRLTRKGRHPSRLVNQGFVPDLNTKGQMLWLVEQLRANPEILEVILSTAFYHNVRCMLTFIAWWERYGDGRELVISMLPTLDPTPEMTVGVVGTNTTLVGEYKRYEDYLVKGDVTTAKVVRKYRLRYNMYHATKTADAD